ncbi:hypothetical protein D7V80_29730 [Corallococcus sp. CA054B]|nr:hypothetical protein D7V80_29730 [Corallococcus sp. CA054B]
MRALSVMALLWGVSAAAQPAPPSITVVVTTDALEGTARDLVVASVVDAGILQSGAPVTMTLRILDEHDAVLATVTGTVSPTAPLRVSTRAPSSAGVRAQLILPPNTGPLSAGVLVLEREGQGEPPPPPTKVVCEIPAQDPDTGMPEPVTMKTCSVVPVET